MGETHRTSTFALPFKFCNAGTKKARVLPVPVLARASMSLPFNAGVSVDAWMSVIVASSPNISAIAFRDTGEMSVASRKRLVEVERDR